MTWNHRVVKHRSKRPSSGTSVYYTIREVYYKDKGKNPYAFSQEPRAPIADTLNDLRWTLSQMLIATYKPLFKLSEVNHERYKSNKRIKYPNK